jgi:hypothetical protein
MLSAARVERSDVRASRSILGRPIAKMPHQGVLTREPPLCSFVSFVVRFGCEGASKHPGEADCQNAASGRSHEGTSFVFLRVLCG